MVEIDFDGMDDTQDYQTIPPGTYVCRLEEVRAGQARDGSERWSLRWVVERGTHAGRLAAWDNLTFNERAVRRVRLILSRLGFPTSGRLALTPDQLQGRRALVTVVADEWANDATGERIRSNRVPYDGYRALREAEEAEDGEEDGARAREKPREEGVPF